jgi:hypothetical protein
METFLETIDLDIDESNELKFKIKMEGKVNSPAKVRLVCEGSDFSYVFNGYGTGEMDVVQFTLPRMEDKIKEGLYKAKVEVLVENRYFAPLQFQLNFKKSVSVVAESVKFVSKPKEEELKVTAMPIKVARQTPQNFIQFERKDQDTINESNILDQDLFTEEQREKERSKKKEEEKNRRPSIHEAYLAKLKKKTQDSPVEGDNKKYATLKEAYLAKKSKLGR